MASAFDHAPASSVPRIGIEVKSRALQQVAFALLTSRQRAAIFASVRCNAPARRCDSVNNSLRLWRPHSAGDAEMGGFGAVLTSAEAYANTQTRV